MKNLGSPQMFLGSYEIQKLILLIRWFKTPERKIKTPISKSINFFDEKSSLLGPQKSTKGRSIVGSLLYLANTVRYDFAFAISLLNILDTLLSIFIVGYPKQSKRIIQVVSDRDSQNGSVVWLNGNAISWSLNKPDTLFNFKSKYI